jgi:hypothetical protein
MKRSGRLNSAILTCIVLPLCSSHGLIGYNAVYLDLPQRRHLSLASHDDGLRRSTTATDVTKLGK